MKTKTTHTPGPWTTPGLSATNQSQIAPIGWLEHGPHVGHDVRKANACLIAAAPELLAALNRCEQLLLSAGYGFTDTVTQARTAITKARGEIGY